MLTGDTNIWLSGADARGADFSFIAGGHTTGEGGCGRLELTSLVRHVGKCWHLSGRQIRPYFVLCCSKLPVRLRSNSNRSALRPNVAIQPADQRP